jgi:CRP-like cAMP-binding protein
MISFDKNIFPPDTDTTFWCLKKTISRNEFIHSPATFNDNMYLVKKGSVKICLFNEKEERETILNFATEGDLVGNLISFLSGEPSQVYLQAIKKTELVGFSKAKFNHLINTNPEFACKYRKALESKIVEIINKQVIHFSQTPQQRIKILLQQKPNIFQQIPKRYIAYYLGLSPETLSRQIKS